MLKGKNQQNVRLVVILEHLMFVNILIAVIAIFLLTGCSVIRSRYTPPPTLVEPAASILPYADDIEHLRAYSSDIIRAEVISAEQRTFILCRSSRAERLKNIYELKVLDVYQGSLQIGDIILHRQWVRLKQQIRCDVEERLRMEYIYNLTENPSLSNLRWYLHFVAHPFYTRYKNKKYKKYITYENILEIIDKSSAVLEIQHEDGNGFTLRTLEAMYFEKKLISTNKFLMNVDFYHSDNIFLLGINNIDTLPDFLKTPYRPIDKDIVSRYSVESWMDRFVRNVSKTKHSADLGGN
jgi:hypothetical protein